MAALDLDLRVDPAHLANYWAYTDAMYAAGGLDPHMRYVGRLIPEGATWQERVWRGGVYMAFYNAGAAEVASAAWPYERMRAEPDALYPWLAEHWAGLPWRRQRRTANTPTKMNDCLTSYARWVELLPLVLAHAPGSVAEAYERVWESANRDIRRFGRYASFKLLEYLRRHADVPIRLPDIRAKGGWSPRTTLGMLYPGAAAALSPRIDTPDSLRASDYVAAQLAERWEERYGVPRDYYTLEVGLCDYKQYWTRRQYPERPLDSEWGYYAAAQVYWSTRSAVPSRIPTIRRACHPPECLGELQGWAGVRKALQPTLRDCGYVWSDLRYVYTEGMDVAQPRSRTFDIAELTRRARAFAAHPE